jgi:hypothetical protein
MINCEEAGIEAQIHMEYADKGCFFDLIDKMTDLSDNLQLLTGILFQVAKGL